MMLCYDNMLVTQYSSTLFFSFYTFKVAILIHLMNVMKLSWIKNTYFIAKLLTRFRLFWNFDFWIYNFFRWSNIHIIIIWITYIPVFKIIFHVIVNQSSLMNKFNIYITTIYRCQTSIFNFWNKAKDQKKLYSHNVWFMEHMFRICSKFYIFGKYFHFFTLCQSNLYFCPYDGTSANFRFCIII